MSGSLFYNSRSATLVIMDIGPYDSARRPRPPLAFPPSEGRSRRPLDPEATPAASPCGLASVSPADGELTKEARPGDAGDPSEGAAGDKAHISGLRGGAGVRRVPRRRIVPISPGWTPPLLPRVSGRDRPFRLREPRWTPEICGYWALVHYTPLAGATCGGGRL